MNPTINPKMVQLEPGMVKLYLDIEKSVPNNPYANPCAEVVLKGSDICTLQSVHPDEEYEEIEDLVG